VVAFRKVVGLWKVGVMSWWFGGCGGTLSGAEKGSGFPVAGVI